MVDFTANLVYDDGENVIGWDVVVTSEAGDVIGSVAVTDQTTIQGLRNDLEELAGEVISIDDVKAVLLNTQEDTPINATLLSGIASDGYAKTVHTHDDRYFTESEVNALLLNKAGVNHTHSVDDVSDFGAGVLGQLTWTKVYEAPRSSFDTSNIDTTGTNFIKFWKCGNLILFRYYFTTHNFSSSVVGTWRNVIPSLPSFVQASEDFTFSSVNSSNDTPIKIAVGNDVTIRPYQAIKYVAAGNGLYIAKNKDLE